MAESSNEHDANSEVHARPKLEAAGLSPEAGPARVQQGLGEYPVTPHPNLPSSSESLLSADTSTFAAAGQPAPPRASTGENSLAGESPATIASDPPPLPLGPGERDGSTARCGPQIDGDQNHDPDPLNHEPSPILSRGPSRDRGLSGDCGPASHSPGQQIPPQAKGTPARDQESHESSLAGTILGIDPPHQGCKSAMPPHLAPEKLLFQQIEREPQQAGPEKNDRVSQPARPSRRPLPALTQPKAAGKNYQAASPVTHAVLTIAMLGITLAAARFFVPPIIEESRYAWRRGQLRAEYESSQDGLRDVGMEKLASAYRMVSQRVGPCVVHIDVARRSPLLENPLGLREIDAPLSGSLPEDQGSGVIVDADGYILTNHHVIADGNEISVGLSDGRRLRATVVGSDPLTDLALLRVNADNLMALEWGDSEATEVGIPVWAVGSPFGLDHTVTFGILSGKHRAAKAGTSYQDFMQSDVAVNPGNSGGPLVDSLGKLIGINTAIVGDTYRGVSFSVPSNVAKRVYERLRSTGRFERGWLGVELAEVTTNLPPNVLPTRRGAVIRRLADPKSPAANAGLISGDIIVRFDGQEVEDVSSLMRMVGNWPAGQSAVLDVVRDGQEQAFSVQIGSRPETFGRR